MWGTVLSVGANLLGSSMQADAASDAGRDQSDATRAGIDENRRQFDLSREDMSAWTGAGRGALANLTNLLGISDPRGTPAVVNSPLLRKFTVDDFNNDPVMQKSFEFGLSEGEKAVRRMFGAKGLARSGGAVKAATRFAMDYGGQQAGASRDRFISDQTNVLNRLATISGTGQAGASKTAELGANMATNNAALAVGGANARGAAGIAGANAYAGALSNAGNAIQRKFIMDDVIGSGGRTPSWSTPPYIPPVSGIPGQFNLDTYG